MVYTLLSGPMVYALFPCFPGKWYASVGVRQQTQKGGVPQWWCILFFPWFKAISNQKVLCVEGVRNLWGGDHQKNRAKLQNSAPCPEDLLRLHFAFYPARQKNLAR